MSGLMVRAILDGNKTQTRRLVKPQPPTETTEWRRASEVTWSPGKILPSPNNGWFNSEPQGPGYRKQPYQPGDRLRVGEAWRTLAEYDQLKPSELPDYAPIWYEADGPDPSDLTGRYRQGRFLPYRFRRLTLEVVSVGAERLQQISEQDAIAEGVGTGFVMNGGWPDYQHINKAGVCELTQDTARASYASLWDHINGTDS